MYYTKVVFGVLSGSLTVLFCLVLNISLSYWLITLISSLLICVTFIRIGLNIPVTEVDQKRLFLSGTFTFVILYIVSIALGWMFLYPIFSS